jgi:hypothetical protein
MTAVMVEIRPGAAAPEQDAAPSTGLPTTIPESDFIEVIADMGDFSEVVMCNCSASDDNPY